MATQRDRPYGNFNFIVEVDGVALGGFAEVTSLGQTTEVIEYRAGSDPQNAVRKLPGLVKYSNVVLKRGLAGALDLHQWTEEVRNGSGKAYRTVVIKLLDESRADVVWTWKLLRAWPAKYSFSPLEAKGKDVVVEILELALERLEIE
jgi:phage tail-like protein